MLGLTCRNHHHREDGLSMPIFPKFSYAPQQFLLYPHSNLWPIPTLTACVDSFAFQEFKTIRNIYFVLFLEGATSSPGLFKLIHIITHVIIHPHFILSSIPLQGQCYGLSIQPLKDIYTAALWNITNTALRVVT